MNRERIPLRTVLALSTGTFIVSVGGLVYTTGRMANENYKNDPAYKRSVQLNSAEDSVFAAIVDLRDKESDYIPNAAIPGTYFTLPERKINVNDIQEAETEISSALSKMGNQDNIDEDLTKVAARIEDKLNQGVIEEAVFEPERTDLESINKSIEEARNQLITDQRLQVKKRKYQKWEFISSALIVPAAVSFFSFMGALKLRWFDKKFPNYV